MQLFYFQSKELKHLTSLFSIKETPYPSTYRLPPLHQPPSWGHECPYSDSSECEMLERNSSQGWSHCTAADCVDGSSRSVRSGAAHSHLFAIKAVLNKKLDNKHPGASEPAYVETSRKIKPRSKTQRATNQGAGGMGETLE